jgi:membrane-associated phospholipid phosphatase
MLNRLHHNTSVALALMLLLALSRTAVAGSMVHTQDADQAAGDIFQYLLPALGLAGAAYNGDKEGMKEWGYSMGATILATDALKAGFNSTSLGERPNGGQHSFPSGHTSMACAGATFIGERYGWDLGAVAMVPAAFVGWNRVDEDMHHWRDVIVGCALGTGLTMYFTKPDDKHQFTVLPDIGDHSFSLGFTMKY